MSKSEHTQQVEQQVANDAPVTDGLDTRVVSIARTTKVVKGGRNFSFSVIVVIGDRKGRIGYGLGKAKEISAAIQKATEAARRNMRYIPLNGSTLHHDIHARHGATKILMKPAAPGTGIIAGGATRDVLEVVGVRDVRAKNIKASNAHNVVLATLKGLQSMVTPEYVANKRGKTISEVLGKYHAEESAGEAHTDQTQAD